MDKSREAVKVYDKIFLLYDREFKSPSGHIDDFLSLLPKKGKILDVGCGNGVDANHMASKGFNVIGIDLSRKMLALAKQKYPDIEFRLEDMRKVKFKDEEFDGLLLSHSIIHIPKREVKKTLKRLSSFLKKGGVIYFAIQEGKSKEQFIKDPLDQKEEIFLNIFSYNEFREIIEQLGLSIIRKYQRKEWKKRELDFNKLCILARK